MYVHTLYLQNNKYRTLLLYKQLAGLNFYKLGNRQAAWFGPTDYCYSSYTHPINNKWPSYLEQLRLQLCNDFTSCLVNFYPDGMSGVMWHSELCVGSI